MNVGGLIWVHTHNSERCLSDSVIPLVNLRVPILCLKKGICINKLPMLALHPSFFFFPSSRHNISMHILYALVLLVSMTTIHAAPIKDTTTKTSTSGVQVIEQEYLNQILSTDSDEDVYFGRTWSDLFDEAQQDLKAALMMVSSSSDDHVIEMTILTRTKEQMTESYPLDDNNDEDDMDFMSDT